METKIGFKMLYRDHRGSLEASMRTTIDVYYKSDIVNHLNIFYNKLGNEVVDIYFQFSKYDTITGWHTYLVMQKLKNDSHYTVAGMSNSNKFK